MSSFIPVTRTKIIVPRRRAEILSRSRLIELLDELLDNRLIIVAAPAGYGKTSLLVDYASATQWPFCWYALDSLDADPQRFIAHFIAALNVRFPQFGKICLESLQNMSQDRLDLDLLISLIINDAYENIPEHFILVLDDFHLVTGSDEIIYFVNRFIQEVDENCHLILVSRRLLNLPDLTLMVARSQVGGLSFEELTFQPEEIQRLLNQNYNLAISAEEATELARESEGWVTGLLLSTQAMGKASANRLRVARVSGVGLYEYLAQQVLAQQAAEVQTFLMRSALLDEFDELLCEQVIGQALGAQFPWRLLMDTVLRLNLFVLPVGEYGQSLRYHHLFQDFLRERIRRERPEEAHQIQNRLAEYYMEREEWERAFELLKSLGKIEALADLVERAGSQLISSGRVLTLSQWLEALPADMMNRRPVLIALNGIVSVTRGDSGQGLKLLDRAVESLRGSGEAIHLAHTLDRRSSAYRLAGQYQNALGDAEEALALMDPIHKGNPIYADALLNKASALYSLGQLNQSLTLLESSLSAYQSLGDENSVARVWIEIGRISRALGRPLEAEDAYSRALEIYQARGNHIRLANLYNNLGVLQHDRGDYAAAMSSFEKAIQYARLGGSVRLEAYVLTSIGDLYQELDAVQETFEAYRQAREIAQRAHEGYLLFYINLMEARLQLAEGHLAQAEAMVLNGRAQAEERGSRSEQHMCQLEWGRLMLALGRPADALEGLGSALAFFVHQNYEALAARARLFLMTAAARLGERELANQQAQLLQPLLAQPDKLKVLISAGREIYSDLERLRGEAELSGLVIYLLDQIASHVQGIPALRRMIRRHAVVVPFASPKLTIRALGKTQVYLSERLVTSSDWQVQTARDLFFLLLAHPEGLNKEQIGEIFWPDSSTSELKLRFKNTIYRLRHAAGKDVIVFQGESLYLFNREVDYEYDVESFQKELALAEKSSIRQEKMEHYRAAVRLYRGAFLIDAEGAWVEIERERLYQSYMGALLRLAEMHLQAGEFEPALQYCQRALKEDSCQEDAHRVAMQVYAAMGNRALVIRQYEQCCRALLDEVDALPSYQTKVLYESLIK